MANIPGIPDRNGLPNSDRGGGGDLTREEAAAHLARIGIAARAASDGQEGLVIDLSKASPHVPDGIRSRVDPDGEVALELPMLSSGDRNRAALDQTSHGSIY